MNAATPSVKVISPYVPLIVLLLRVTVKLKALSVSPAFPDTTFETVKSPVSGSSGVIFLVFINSAAAVASLLIVPVSPVCTVTYPSWSASVSTTL